MAIFDEVLRDVQNRFKLNGKAEVLLNNLLTEINNNQNNSLAGFLESFHRAGLGNVAETWVASGANTPLSQQQLTDALGREKLEQIAQRADVPKETTVSALAYMIPLVIDQLTPNGFVPTSHTFSTASGQQIANQSNAELSAVSAQNLQSVSSESERETNSLLRVLLPLMLVGILAFLSFRFCSTPNQAIDFPNANRITNQNSNLSTRPSTHSHAH